MAESTVATQVRLVLERQCRDVADVVAAKVPAGVAFLLFLADFGYRGNTAYVASCAREDAVKLVVEWLDRQDQNADAASLRELLGSAGHLLETIAKASGLPAMPEDPMVLINHCVSLSQCAEAEAMRVDQACGRFDAATSLAAVAVAWAEDTGDCQFCGEWAEHCEAGRVPKHEDGCPVGKWLLADGPPEKP